MSYDAYSYAVFGVKTSRENLKQKTKIRGCKHKIKENMKFCPECGKPTYIEQDEEILEGMNFRGLSYFCSDYSRSEDIVVGFCLAKTSYSDNMTPIEIETPTPGMALEILEFCQKHKLPYTEKHLKSYVMTYHSY